MEARAGQQDEPTSLLQMAAAQDFAFETARTKPRQDLPIARQGQPRVTEDTQTELFEGAPPNAAPGGDAHRWDNIQTEKWDRPLAPAPPLGSAPRAPAPLPSAPRAPVPVSPALMTPLPVAPSLMTPLPQFASREPDAINGPLPWARPNRSKLILIIAGAGLGLLVVILIRLSMA